MIFSFSSCILSTDQFYRPTGWHGESGAEKAEGHFTVDFYRWDNGRKNASFFHPQNQKQTWMWMSGEV